MTDVKSVAESASIITLKENRFSLFSLVLVILAFVLAGYVAYLNVEVTRVAGAQLVQAQQIQEKAQSAFLKEYANFLHKQSQLARFEKTFEVKQKHYADFMGALSDAWVSANRKNKDLLDQALNQLAKSYFAIEPFLSEPDRHNLQKRITIFHNLAKQLAGYEPVAKGISLSEKSTMDRMIEEFQTFLFPLLFEPTYQGTHNETGQ